MAYIAPGMPAPKTGTYVLFDRYRVPTGVAVWREKGDPLPLVTVAGYGPLYYRRVEDAMDDAA